MFPQYRALIKQIVLLVLLRFEKYDATALPSDCLSLKSVK